MTVRNLEAERLTSNINIQELGRAMAKIDLKSIPAEKRQSAVMDQLMRVMADSITDRDKAHEIEISRLLHNGY